MLFRAVRAVYKTRFVQYRMSFKKPSYPDFFCMFTHGTHGIFKNIKRMTCTLENRQIFYFVGLQLCSFIRPFILQLQYSELIVYVSSLIFS